MLENALSLVSEDTSRSISDRHEVFARFIPRAHLPEINLVSSDLYRPTDRCLGVGDKVLHPVFGGRQLFQCGLNTSRPTSQLGDLCAELNELLSCELAFRTIMCLLTT